MTRLGATALAAVALSAFAPTAQAGTLYTNNYSSKQLAGLSIGANGLLAPLAGSPFPVADFPGGIAITPDGRLLVTAFNYDHRVSAQAVAANGAISQVGAPISADVASGVAISPTGIYAYVSAQANGVFAFRIGADGSLVQIGGAFGSASGSMPAVTPDGRFVLLPDYDAEAIERLAVQPDGSLVPIGTTTFGVPGVETIRITPDGRFAVVLSNGAGVGDIRSFAIGIDGSLTASGSPLPTVGTVAGLPVLSPNGRYYYVPNGNEKSVSAYTIDATGALSAIAAPVPSGIEPEALAMSVDGRFLYAQSVYGEEIQAFAVAGDGALSKIGGPTPTGGESDGSTPIPRPAAPTAHFIATAAAPGAKTTFDATASSDPGATLTTYAWNFGDGKSTANGGPTPSHTYAKAGVYEVSLAVGDDAGCVALVYTGQTAYCSPQDAYMTVRVDTLPAISKLKVAEKSFAVTSTSRKKARRPGTAFTYTLSEKAGVVFTVQRKRIGHKVGKACLPGAKGKAAKRKCTLLRPLGSFKASGKAGKNTTRFSGKVKGRKLRPGPYVATAVATDAATGKSAPRSVGFEIVRPVRTAESAR